MLERQVLVEYTADLGCELLVAVLHRTGEGVGLPAVLFGVGEDLGGGQCDVAAAIGAKRLSALNGMA
ncbi:hypothetical protein GCM10011579_098570 [Streptomyces albiflavescens]|uniref:Uncharacterized protein n=1 Tax=Streptomyces albiflavescens TaxID=1623582 RepID=A0A917YHJ6_9ACTN|nr:hypothetical protein GCM10011579_098570 [Streptomyces albiflavescens]